MNKSKKIIIALIAVLTAVALFLLGVMSLFIVGGDKLEDMLDKREDDLKTVVFQKEYSINDFQNMKIDCGCADVTFKPSQNGNVAVTVFGANDNKFSGEIKDKTLELNEIYGKATFRWARAIKFKGFILLLKFRKALISRLILMLITAILILKLNIILCLMFKLARVILKR